MGLCDAGREQAGDSRTAGEFPFSAWLRHWTAGLPRLPRSCLSVVRGLGEGEVEVDTSMSTSDSTHPRIVAAAVGWLQTDIRSLTACLREPDDEGKRHRQCPGSWPSQAAQSGNPPLGSASVFRGAGGLRAISLRWRDCGEQGNAEEDVGVVDKVASRERRAGGLGRFASGRAGAEGPVGGERPARKEPPK